MGYEDLIFTPSGIRGIFGESLTESTVKKIALAFGIWLKEKRVIMGRDNRPSGIILEEAVIEGLLLSGCEIINLGMCPTPVIINEKNKRNVPAGIIISGSHNPPEWNALKLISKETFSSKKELEEISNILDKLDMQKYGKKELEYHKVQRVEDAIKDYIQDVSQFIDIENIKQKNNLRVVVDPGAGAGKEITPYLLEKLGCEVKVINRDFDENGNFPREIEPIGENLQDLIVTLWKEKYDIGFAHDCDADRLAIIGDDFQWYPEDIGLAIITEYMLQKYHDECIQVKFITNVASSLMFDALTEKYGAEIIRTPIGERYLVEEMNHLLIRSKSTEVSVFGGEGSCGGVMFPQFNNARDGIFAAAKIVEILVKTGKKISELVSQLPKYYSCREQIEIDSENIEQIIKLVKEELINEGEDVQQIDNDLRFGHKKDWFVLIHPSNTEPIIRVITEAKRESLAKIYCETAAKLVKMVIEKV
ncbi:MAG: hypothetical protein EU548_01055 [Promethearchaeota archaeon]|nr:MAG: hypothetical protein EU548_01055 [Candidatus Lokiarchaeota archaeon]